MSYRRNIFAKIRTLMANERTLLSYYRTALAAWGVAGFLMKFYEATIFKVLAGIFAVAGLILFVYGSISFFNNRKKIMKR